MTIRREEGVLIRSLEDLKRHPDLVARFAAMLIEWGKLGEEVDGDDCAAMALAGRRASHSSPQTKKSIPMDDVERQGRIGELLRVAILQAELQKRIDERLTMSGHTETISEQDILKGLDEVAAVVATTSTSKWAGCITYLLAALDNETEESGFRHILEVLRDDISTRLEVGRW